MRKLIGQMLRKTGGLFFWLSRKVYESPDEIRVQKWYRDMGDKTLRLKYDLNRDSIVLDLGGYEGQWTSDIFGMYQCEIHVFEPVSQFATEIRQRFARNSRVHVHDFGLADRTHTVEMHLASDGSSMYRSRGASVSARLVDATTFLKSAGIEHIDLMKINIEGGEYDLLDRLIDTGIISQVRNIQVQFHDCIPEAALRMRQIQNALAHTHKLTYQYEFVWENWEAKQWPWKIEMVASR